MAIPTNLQSFVGMPLRSGVVLGVSPSSDPTFTIEVQRGNNTTATMNTIGQMQGRQAGKPAPQYTDPLPVGSGTFYYRARNTAEGYVPSDWTATVAATPTYLPEFPPIITPLSGAGIGASLFVSTKAPPKVGSAQVQTYVRKYLNIPFTDMASGNPPAGGLTPLFSPPVGIPETHPVGVGVFAAMLPPGVTVREASLTGRIGSSTGTIFPLIDGVSCYLALSETDLGSYSTIAALSITSTFGAGVWSVSATSLQSLASTDNMLVGRVVVTAAASSQSAGVVAVRVGYDMPSYDKAV